MKLGKAAGLSVAILLAACNTTPKPAVVAVAAPVAPVVVTPPPVIVPATPPSEAGRGCVPRALSPAPRYPDTDAALKAAAGAADRYQLLAAGRLMRQRRLEELERIVAGCR